MRIANRAVRLRHRLKPVTSRAMCDPFTLDASNSLPHVPAKAKLSPRPVEGTHATTPEALAYAPGVAVGPPTAKSLKSSPSVGMSTYVAECPSLSMPPRAQLVDEPSNTPPRELARLRLGQYASGAGGNRGGGAGGAVPQRRAAPETPSPSVASRDGPATIHPSGAAASGDPGKPATPSANSPLLSLSGLLPTPWRLPSVSADEEDSGLLNWLNLYMPSPNRARPDAGTLAVDAGASAVDTEASHADAGASHADAGASHADAGASHADAEAGASAAAALPALPAMDAPPGPPRDAPEAEDDPVLYNTVPFPSSGAPSPSIIDSFDPSKQLLTAFSRQNPFAVSSALFNTDYALNKAHARRSFSSSPPRGDESLDGAKKFMDDDDSHMDVYSQLKDKYDCPKYPIVLCHGLFGFDTIGPANIKSLQISYWVGVKDALEAMGAEVLIDSVPMSASIEERARVLCDEIEKTFPNREINLVGHSMGGLDARYLISRLEERSFTVKSLTTISTPHRGSSFADYLLEEILGPTRIPALLSAMEAIGIPGGGKAFENLTTSNMEKFNQETPDVEGVKYFSYGACFRPAWSSPFRLSWGLIFQREGPNDGLVSLKSSNWGEYKATLVNVDHMDLVGWVGGLRYGWAELVGRPIKYKPISFFCSLAEMLANEGF